MTHWTKLLESAQLLQEAGKLSEAEALYKQALAAAPHEAAVYHLFGLLRMGQGRLGEAEELLRAACERIPHRLEALLHHALSLTGLGRTNDALAVLDRLLVQKPDAAGAWNNRAENLAMLGKLEDALIDFKRALTINPRLVQSWEGQGNVLLDLGRFEGALLSFDKALSIRPQLADALFGRARALVGLKRASEALPIFDLISSWMPSNSELWLHRAIALEDLGYFDGALQSYDQAISLRPQSLIAHNNRSIVLQRLGRYHEAAKGYEAILIQAPESDLALNGLANCALYTCDWSRVESFALPMRACISAGGRMQLGTVLGYFSDPALHLAAAQNYIKQILPNRMPPLWCGPRFCEKRIRIAYCSANFNSHPMPRLLAGIFENHNRNRFEVLAISFGIDDKSDMRRRLVRSFDHFHDVAGKSDFDIARLIAALGVDIAVDLMGHTNHGRPAIFAARPAPIQINYMGFPGTLGVDFYDYIIGDEIILPLEHQSFYAEKIVQLPGSYIANDDRRATPSVVPERKAVGLPQAGFVFCCFNNNWKITAAIFAVWMRLLHAIAGSVLWLLEDNREAVDNLRSAARAYDIAPDRIVFAPRVKPEAHLARHCLADLFLDTLPYNAHTTASDSLWVGVPVLTVKGEAFHSRVAASVLSAIGMPELIAKDLEEYERLALSLARDQTRLAMLRQKLAHNRSGWPLFNTVRSVRNIETAYQLIGEIFRKAGGPRAITMTEILFHAERLCKSC